MGLLQTVKATKSVAPPVAEVLSELDELVLRGPEDEDDPIPDRLRTTLIRLLAPRIAQVRKRYIAILVLGLHADGECFTLTAIGEVLGVSRERVRQLRARIFPWAATKLARDIECASKLNELLREISPDADWRDPATTARSVVQLMTDNYFAAPMITYLLCLAAGSELPRADLRQQCVAAVDVATKERDKRAVWRFDRWNDAQAKAIFHTVTLFQAPPSDLIGLKRTPHLLLHDQNFASKRLGRTVACESGTEARVYRWLERSPDVLWYQEQPASLEYEFEGLIRHYYPDVAVMGTDGRVVIVEVKPIFGMYRFRTLAKAIAALNHYGPQGVGYLLVDASGRTLDDVASREFPEDVAGKIEALFREQPVRFGLVRRELTLLLGRFESMTFASMVVNRDWCVTDGPGVEVSKLPRGFSFRALLRRGCSL